MSGNDERQPEKAAPEAAAVQNRLNRRVPRSFSVPTSPKTQELRNKHEARRATDVEAGPKKQDET